MEAAVQLDIQSVVDNSPKENKVMPENSYNKHVLRIGAPLEEDWCNYSLNNTLFSNHTALTAIHTINSSKKIDGLLISPNQLTSHVLTLKLLAKEKSIPFILYTLKFSQEYKELALKKGMDDYFCGDISDASLRRMAFISKLKTYKNKRGDKPYVNPKVEDVVKIKLWTLKRTFDLAVSGTCLILLAPLFLAIALLVKFGSKGPIFYISKRAGSGYKIFDFYKFRSMRVGADSDLTKLAHLNQYSEQKQGVVFFKIKNDPRVTRLGQFLRDTSLDELPQLLNVFIGDMSLVGNRPLPLYEAKQLTKDQIAWRFLAPAGITGLWQITKRGKENMSEDERIQLDMEYAIKNSFLYDIKILLGTLPALLQKQAV